MKAQKVTIKITVQGLSKDILRGQLLAMLNCFDREQVQGRLESEDGDLVCWETEFKSVEF